MAVLLLAAVLFIGLGIRDAGKPDDLYTYQLAAERIVQGQQLYVNPGFAHDLTYLSAPWVAWLWIPLNGLPGDLGPALWRVACLAAALSVIVTLGRVRGPAGPLLAAMALPMLGAVPQGNVGVLMVGLLVVRRADPWSVAIATSLKVYPLLLVLGYVAERRWRDLALALGLAAGLWLPALLFNIGDWRIPPPVGAILPASVLPWLVPALGAVLVMLAIRGSRWIWLAIGASMPLAIHHNVGVEYVWMAALTGDPSPAATQSSGLLPDSPREPLDGNPLRG